MSEIIIYDFCDYREYIELKLRRPEYGRGAKAQLAEHLGCQPSFVSQVLKDKSTFSLEQAFKLNRFFKHNALEQEYFMVLVEWDRAGTLELKKYFQSKREALVEKSKLIENQMSYDELSQEDAIAYFNNFHHVQIRNLIDIPALKNKKNLQKHMGITVKDFDTALGFLKEKGLVIENEQGELLQGQTRIHIKKESPLAKYANITARMQIIKKYDEIGYDSLNYGSYMTLPKKSFEEFKKRFVALIVDLNNHLEEEPEAEMMAALIVDFMEIK